jgi:anti-sigma B factor antagonist
VPPQPEPPERREAASALPTATPPAVHVDLTPGAPPGYAALVSLHGEHDLASSDTLRAALAPLLGDVVVDLSACTFMDSTVIGVLLGKCYDLRDEGRRLELVLPPENVAISRVVDVVGLRGLMLVHERMPAGPAGS